MTFKFLTCLRVSRELVYLYTLFSLKQVGGRAIRATAPVLFTDQATEAAAGYLEWGLGSTFRTTQVLVKRYTTRIEIPEIARGWFARQVSQDYYYVSLVVNLGRWMHWSQMITAWQ